MNRVDSRRRFFFQLRGTWQERGQRSNDGRITVDASFSHVLYELRGNGRKESLVPCRCAHCVCRCCWRIMWKIMRGFAGGVCTPLKQPLDANKSVNRLPGWLRKGCYMCGAAGISCCRCGTEHIRREAMEISCCRMRGRNRCISNIGLISNSRHADAGTGRRCGSGRGRGLDNGLRNIQRGPGSFRLVLLPFLCQGDVREHSYLDNVSYRFA